MILKFLKFARHFQPSYEFSKFGSDLTQEAPFSRLETAPRMSLPSLCHVFDWPGGRGVVSWDGNQSVGGVRLFKACPIRFFWYTCQQGHDIISLFYFISCHKCFVFLNVFCFAKVFCHKNALSLLVPKMVF